MVPQEAWRGWRAKEYEGCGPDFHPGAASVLDLSPFCFTTTDPVSKRTMPAPSPPARPGRPAGQVPHFRRYPVSWKSILVISRSPCAMVTPCILVCVVRPHRQRSRSRCRLFRRRNFRERENGNDGGKIYLAVTVRIMISYAESSIDAETEFGGVKSFGAETFRCCKGRVFEKPLEWIRNRKVTGAGISSAPVGAQGTFQGGKVTGVDLCDRNQNPARS